MKAIFIAGTDTGAGKTVVAGLLAQYMNGRGYRAVTQKWVQTGGPSSHDINTHLRLMARPRSEFAAYSAYMSPYVFGPAVSPHLAARMERIHIKTGVIRRSFEKLRRGFDIVIVEGSGGLLVPLGGGRLLADVVKELDIPVLLVSDNRLGAINHSLLSVEALESRSIKTIGIVFSATATGRNRAVLKDNPAIIGELGGVEVLGALPHARTGLLRKLFVPVGRKIEKMLWKN